MMTINRTVVFVTPKQPYLDWASSFDDDRPLSLEEKIFSTAYLIPDTYDELNYGKWLKSLFYSLKSKNLTQKKEMSAAREQHLLFLCVDMC